MAGDCDAAERFIQDNGKEEKQEFRKFEDVLVYIGEYGKTQMLFFAAMILALPLMIMENMAMVFLAGVPSHHCFVDEDLKNLTIPTEVDKNGEITYSQCEVYDINRTGSFLDNYTATVPCSEAVGRWSYDKSVFNNTIVSEWDLVCDSKWLRAFSKMVYFFGFFIGCLVVSDFSDRFGRRRTTLATLLVLAMSSTAVYFAPNYIVFTLLRFVVGVTVGGFINSSVVLRMEWSTARQRVPLQAIATIFITCGYILVGVSAYLTKDWRNLSLIIALPKILMLIVFYFVAYPSPRWLLTQGRKQEALEQIQKAAARNGRPLPDDFDIDAIVVPTKTRISLLDLVRTPNIRKTTLIVWYTWFAVAMVSYAISYNVGYLSGDIYFSFIVMQAVVFIRVPITFVLHYINRRIAIMVFAALTGVSLLVVMATDEDSPVARLALSSAGNTFSGTLFGLIYLYSVEVYPTPMRTIGLGIGSMWARVGTMLSPYVVLLSEVSTTLPFIVCGAAAMVIAVLFSVAPETRNRPLTDNVEEAEIANKLFFRLREPKSSALKEKPLVLTVPKSTEETQ